MSAKWKELPSATSGFGVELEFHVPYNIKTNHPKSKFFPLFKESRSPTRFSSLKSDCTCGRCSDYDYDYGWSGLEIVLGVFPLDDAGTRHFQEMLSSIYHDIFLLKNEARCKTPFSRSCGFHLHLSKDLFSKDTLETFFQLFYDYQDGIFEHLVHSSRSKNENIYKMSSSFPGYSHFVCTNVSESHPTVEIRHAGMTYNQESLINWVKFVRLMYQVSQNDQFFDEFTKTKELLPAIKKFKAPRWFGKTDFLKWVKMPVDERFPIRVN
jgi:hypothetical protein